MIIEDSISNNEVQATAKNIVAAIACAIGDAPAALHEPHFLGNEWKYLKECLDSNFVSSIGKFVNRFESEVAAYTGTDYAVAVVNGTAALHIALKLADVKPNDEVLIPTLTFVATANAVAYCGATPHFVDCEEATLGMSAQALRSYLKEITVMRDGICINLNTGKRIRAMVPMHTYGHPVDIEGLLDVANDYGLVLIEDAAESFGSFYKDRHTGTFGQMGILSFNGNKTITTGGGGVILTNSEYLARRAKHLTTTAKIPHHWAYEHDEIGYNYRMPNLNAALGCAQLEQLPDFLKSKRNLYDTYHKAFAGVHGVRLVGEPPRCASNFWLQTLCLDKANLNLRDTILSTTNNAGYSSRPAWSLIHKLQHFKNCPKAPLPIAESLEYRLINIPSSVILNSRIT